MLRFLLFLSLFSLGREPRVALDELPNIVLILADDMGSGDPRCANADSKVPTPSLDRLAREGVRVTDAHSPSAVCTPTRYGVLTGRYSWRSRLKKGVLVGTSRALIEEGRSTVASMLKSKGYRTACMGKWHLGLGNEEPVDYSKPLRPGPLDVGFDEFFGIPASLDMEPYLFVDGDKPFKAPTDKIEGSKMRRAGGGGFWRKGRISPGFRHIDVLPRLAARAVRFIDGAKENGQPFFLYFPLPAPHTPWLPTEDFVGTSGAGVYGDFAAQVDHVVGQVIDAVERIGATENTLIIFTSDNGAHWKKSDIEEYGHLANGTLRGQKADIHEGGHRVPFLARWPKRVPAGVVRDDLVCLTDFYATFASLVGHALGEGEAEDSIDVLGVLEGADFEEPPRTSVVHHSLQGVFAIRSGNMKLIEGLGSGGFTKPARVDPEQGGPTGQLYDLFHDPAEEKNLWLERPEDVERLTGMLNEIRSKGRSR